MMSVEDKVIRPEELAGWLRRRSGAGPVAVVTGTYDILQPGNLHVLERARAAGSTVLVVLENDLEAGRHVAEGRPQHALDVRVEVVASLRQVSGVTWGDLPGDCFRGMPAPVWVIGKPQRAGDRLRTELEAICGEVLEVDPVPGCFTEEILQAIREHQTPISVPLFVGAEAPSGIGRRFAGRRVTVNGCFDILHVGHLRFLQQARMLGDSLTVLINSDNSVARYKGPTRPVFPSVFRSEALRALSAVDEVVVFEGDNPLDVIGRIRPDIHVKGGSFEPERVRHERELVESWGGKLVGTPMVEGFSTTSFIKKATAGMVLPYEKVII